MPATLVRVTDLLPQIAARADDVENERHVSAEILDDLRRTGALRMLSPGRHGGGDEPLPTVLQVVESVSTADASVGWTVAQHAQAQLILRHFPAATVDRVFSGSPDLLAAGAVAPKGRATRIADGWQINGQWPFVSGAPQATWFFVQCLEVKDGSPVLDPDDLPVLRLALLAAEQLELVDTWSTMGLRGTASHDVRVNRAECDDAYTCHFASTPPGDEPILRIPARDLGGLFVAAVAVGNAAAALDDTIALALAGKRPAFSPHPLGKSPGFVQRLGAAEVRLRSARALLSEQASCVWESALAGVPLGLRDRAALRSAGPHVVESATAVLDAAYALGGGTSLYDRSPLQRRLRDGHTITQHFAAGPDVFGALGAVLVGADPGTALR